jgi:hypothetical protein
MIWMEQSESFHLRDECSVSKLILPMDVRADTAAYRDAGVAWLGREKETALDGEIEDLPERGARLDFEHVGRTIEV